MSEEQAVCLHPPRKLTSSILVEIPSHQRSEVVVRLEVGCMCGASLSFLGLPSAWQPDCPHPHGSEDDGVDRSIVYLPANWIDSEEVEEEEQ